VRYASTEASHVPVKDTKSNPRWGKDMRSWTKAECQEWLWDVCRVYPKHLSGSVMSEFKIQSGADLASLTFDKLITNKSIKEFRPFHARIISSEVMHRKELAKERYVLNSKPYNWPYNGIMHPANTAVIVIDMQNDFCNPDFKGAYIKSVNPSATFDDVKAIIPNIQALLTAMRKLGYRVLHTRESHTTLSADLPANKHWRSAGDNAPGLGDTNGDMNIRPLTYGTFGWDIIKELTPEPNEPVIDKPTKGVFGNTNIELILKNLGIQNIILTGVTTDVCVHTIMREANDRGYECLLATDSSCSVNKKVWAAAIESVHLSGGIFGCTATSADIIQTISRD